MKKVTAFIAHLKKASAGFTKHHMHGAGFTLIELLVVIGILGILAAALVATIDPFEQLKKANDANTKNTAVEFVNSTIRYYTTHNAMPWTDANQPACTTEASNGSPSGMALSGMPNCLSALVSDGELKPGFTTVTNILSSIFITGGTNNTIACFNPQSKAQNHDANSKYDKFGNTSGSCPVSSGIATSCYWCAQ